jgi:hypothetical protein
VFLIGLGLIDLPLLQNLDNPTRVEVHAEADAAAVLAKMLDREP